MAPPGAETVLSLFSKCTAAGADSGGRESAPLLQNVTHQRGQTGLLSHFACPGSKILFKSPSPDWTKFCLVDSILEGAKVKNSSHLKDCDAARDGNCHCVDELTGKINMCAHKCDRIDDGCQGKKDEIGCSPSDHTWTGIAVVLVIIVVIILLIESILFK